MDRLTGNGPLEQGHHFAHFPDAPIELRPFVDELQAARDRQLDHPARLDVIDIPRLEDNRELVADFVQIMHRVDVGESGPINTASLADLCAINEQIRLRFQRFTPSSYDIAAEMFDMVLSDYNWTTEVIPNYGQDQEYICNAREFMQSVDPIKRRSINTTRLAARIWIDGLPVAEQTMAEYTAGRVFGRLFDDELARLYDSIQRARTPEAAYAVKVKGMNDFCDYAFAGIPMTEQEQGVVRNSMPVDYNAL